MSNAVTTTTGLTAAQVAQRVSLGQVNRVREQTSRSLAAIVRENVFTLFNAIIVGASVIVLLFGHIQDGIFGGVMVINAVIGIVSELRAKRTLDALAIVDAPRAHVVRDSSTQQIPAAEVVLDDVVSLGLGDQIPVDGEALEVNGLEVDESLLTGESRPVKKQAGDRLLAGTSVVAGAGAMRATAVGADVYAQGISAAARQFTRTVSEIQASINRVLQVVSFLLLPVVVLTFWSQNRVAGVDGGDWRNALVLSVASIIGMIPQGLVLLTSMNFALGSATLARRGVLVQELPAVEVLARVDALCVDKTGTLTTGGIRVRSVEVLAGDRDQVLGALATASADRTNATATAIATHLEEEGAPGPLGPQTWGVPFSSARKWSAWGDGQTAWILGAPEIVIDRASEDGARALELAAGAASQGARVVALVSAPAALVENRLPEARLAAAVITLEEDLRQDAAETLDYFRQQGVHVRVISGDNPTTVGALAAQAGLTAPGGGEPRLMDARELPEDTASEEFALAIDSHDVFGRVTPEQKRAMVGALQGKGHCVAMTGDGVNDALALKDADLGIAMGNGSQATKAIAQIVLVDSKFSVLPGVVAEGRRIIANMERVSSLFLAKTTYAAILVIVTALVGWRYPFLPRQFSYIDSLTIGIPAFFLALWPNRRRYVPGFLRRTLSLAMPTGAVLAAAALTAFGIVDGPASSRESTAAILALMVGAIWLLVITSRPLTPVKCALLTAVAVATVGGVALGPVRDFFQMVWPTPQEWAVIVGVGLCAGALIEAGQWIFYRTAYRRSLKEGATARD
ncbi:E1-E2 ATPase [Schaalia georgiae F0490]|uniref:E1-E2 ATPase n=1 Tax=Schaalia georgiae F0490 TaxID=1125717 RepID=J1HZY7_9ACTO|nr:HAD-IC family P-type ATPase [Schaalia georgiae]EJF51558.1 E1-E2 ATPase [Schaalia georgiae F0490]